MFRLLLVILTFVLIGNLSFVFAQEAGMHSITRASVEKEIINITKAPESKRVVLMNAFKKKMALMSETEREEAVALLKKYINRAQRSSDISAQKMIEVRRDEDANTMQKQTLQQMTQYQTVKQKEVVEPTTIIPSLPNILGN